MNKQHNPNASENHDPANSSQEQINGFQALKRLKETEHHIQMLKRRFKVLKVKDEEARSKTIQHENKIRLHDDVQRLRKQNRKSIDRAYLVQNIEVQQYKQKNKKQKQTTQSTIKTVRESLQKDKKELNKVQRKQHFQNELKYEKIKIEDVKEKQKIRNKVIEIQKNQKEKVQRYNQSRIKETHKSKSNDTNFLLNRTTEKQKQLQQLVKLEQELAKKSSDSIQISNLMKSRMTSVLTKKKSLLPDIHSNKTSRQATNTSAQLS